MVGSDGVEKLIADISGAPHLFGGETNLHGDLLARLECAGLQAASANTGTRGASTRWPASVSPRSLI